MRRIFLFIFLLSFVLLSATKNETDKQIEDLSIFRKALLEKEGTLDIHNSFDSIHLFLKYLDFKFSKKLSLLQQFKLYSASLSIIHCGHTQIHPNKNVLFEWLTARNSMPFDVYFIGKHLIVNELIKEDIDLINEGKPNSERSKTIKAGTEIISIDEMSIAKIMQEISPYLSSDENGIDFKYYQAGQLFDFYRHMALPFNKDSIRIEYLSQEDTLEMYFRPGAAPVRTINARSFKNAEQFEKDEEDIGEFKIIRRRGYFRFKSFKACYGKKYTAFLKKSFGKIKSKKVDELIFDLRGNTGGVMQYEIMSYFLANNIILGQYSIMKPKKGIEDRHFKKFTADYIKHRKGSSAQKRLQNKGKFNNGLIKVTDSHEALIYTGKIAVITDEGTFSSAAMLACHLKTLCNAKIIGRPAGGSFYAGNSGSLMLELPNSKLHVFINPNTFYSQLKKPTDYQSIKYPDIFIDTKIVDEKKRDAYYLKTAINSFK